MIAFTFALPQESKDFAHALTDRTQTGDAHLPILRGRIGPHEVAICHTGVGGESTRERVRAFFKLHHPKTLISAGFAGALDPRLETADLVVATNHSEGKLLIAARQIAGERCFYGTLTTQDVVVESREGKATLHQQTGASAVDMETAIIHELCRSFGVEMLSVRSISDMAGEPLPVPFGVWFDGVAQRPRVLALLAFLARHPARIGPFVKFVNGIGRARARLTEFLRELLGQIQP